MDPRTTRYRLGTNQSVTIGATSAASSAFGAQTYAVRVVATSACHIEIGDGTPTATTADPYLPADVPEYFSVTPGQKIATIQASAGGTLHVTELTQ